MASIFKLRRGSGSVDLEHGELYVHSASLQYGDSNDNPVTLLPLGNQISGDINLTGSINLTGDISSNYIYIAGSKSTTVDSGYDYDNDGQASFGGGSQSISLQALQKVTALSYYATSDERRKDILNKVESTEGLDLVKKLEPIKYNWKDKQNTQLSTGFSAQQVIKSGYDHLIGIVDNPELKQTKDDTGFISPEGKQFIMNYEQVIPYHHSVLKYLLDKIESLESEIKELKANK
jgi:hypothetical protein